MLTIRSNAVTLTLYVDRCSQQWIVLDGEGNFWVVPGGREDPWSERYPFVPNETTELEFVPGHYKSMLGLPT